GSVRLLWMTITPGVHVTSRVNDLTRTRSRATASAAAWLPHAKRRDTRMTSGYSNPPSTCWHDWSGALPLGQSLKTTPIAIIPADTHVVDTSYG
ncbi:MAG: hypothetical protein ACUVXC_17685, partial [Chloroflexus sp.]